VLAPPADFADQRAALIEIDRLCPSPDSAHVDAGTQMGVAAPEALEE